MGFCENLRDFFLHCQNFILFFLCYIYKTVVLIFTEICDIANQIMWFDKD